MSADEEKKRQVEEYYGKILSKTEDLKTNACCTSARPPKHIGEALKNVHPDVVAKYYGCGLCLPECLEGGLTVLDLGCGAGRDVYIAAQLVGKDGKVIGVDMTEEQISVAQTTQAWHAERFGFANTEFHKGFIERLDELPLADASIDVIISNCVINLSPDKDAVLKSCYRLLKPGGEVYFSDVYASRRVPKALQDDEILWGECISGALYWNDFHNLAKACGFLDPRIYEDFVITVANPELEKKLGQIRFFSAGYRLWKLDGLESHCEDYGQAVIYKGTIPRCEDAYVLDGHHKIETGKVFPVCGNTWRMLAETRLKEHFQFIGDFSTHYGIYADCGTTMPFESAKDKSGGGGGCC